MVARVQEEAIQVILQHNAMHPYRLVLGVSPCPFLSNFYYCNREGPIQRKFFNAYKTINGDNQDGREK
jgi:hypothetical protein